MSLRILIVAGGRLPAAETTALLRFMGHQVLAASNAEEAIQAATAFKLQLVLIDWSLPIATSVGREPIFDGVPIIAVGNADEADRFFSVGLPGFSGFEQVPCDRSELARLVDWAEDRTFARQDEEKLDAWLVGPPKERRSRRWGNAYLPHEAVVFRLYGGMRDGQELTGDRAAHLYDELDWQPLNRSFRACRTRRVGRGGGTTERHRYFVEAVMQAKDRILVIARHDGGVE
ncbi:MAG TPA: hypothetical protein VG125_32470 [Pirellulales bacterium]|jgi:CheY-like chemotaxis protein|nr:hypothetical protein [Pirellulales bacterium]